MTDKNKDTEQILDAIKEMMSENTRNEDPDLPKDLLDLTNPVESEDDTKTEGLDILELSNPISENVNNLDKKSISGNQANLTKLINEDQIKKAVRSAFDLLPQTKLDELINEELTKIIREKLSSSKIIISTENTKN